MNLKDKTLLITAIGDFVGLRATEMAVERGLKVRGLEHAPEKVEAVEALGIPVVVGSVTEQEVVEEVCQGVDIVFHTESVIDPGGALEHFRQVNVDGAVNIAKAAQKAGVKTFIHLSSVMVYGFKFPDQITEEGPFRGEKNPYCQTKIEAEQELLKLNDPPNFGVIIIRPGDVYGPGAFTWIINPLQLMQQKQFALVNGKRGIINHVYVDNLIDGIFLAAEKESYGEAFNITDGCKTTWQQFYSQLAEIAGEPQPISMPALAMKTAAKTLGKQRGIFPEAVDFLARSNTYSIKKANRVLGYQPRIDLKEGMAKTAAWLRERNYIKSMSNV
jgi:nucleoside-diphosphate-sugar epimerase